MGFALVNAIVAGLLKAGSTDAEAMVAGLRAARSSTRRSAARPSARWTTRRPWAPTSGKLALKDGKGAMVDWRYVDGAAALPGDAEVKALRTAAD